MLIETFIAILIGIILGIITGLVPGIHTNLIASLSIIFTKQLTNNLTEISIILLLTAMLVTSIFLNFIPTLILGVPDPDKTNILRPLHKAVLSGKAYQLIKEIAIVLLITTLSFIIFFPILNLIIPKTTLLTKLISFLLTIFITIPIIKDKQKIPAIIITLCAGILGITIFSIPSINQPLLPLLAGLFGVSSIITNLIDKTENQNKLTKLKNQFFPTYIKIKDLNLKRIPFYTLLTSITSIIPAISASQIASLIPKSKNEQKTNPKNYIALCASLTISTALISIITAYSLNKSRNGVVLAMLNFLKDLSAINTILILLTIIISASLSAILLITLSKLLLKNINKIPIEKISIAVILILISLTFLISGIYGIIILITACSLGIITQKLNLNQNYLMASLIIPTFFYFL